MAEEKDKDEEGKKPAEGEGGAEGAEAAPAKKGLNKKMLIIAAAGAFLVLGGGGGAAFFLLHGKGDASKAGEMAKMEAEHNAKPTYFSLGDLLVNLSGDNKHPNFLKVKISLELADEKDLPIIEAIKPRIIDDFQVYLRELRIDDLRGSAGLYRLREELLLRVTEAAQPVRIHDVLFQEMLVQ